MKIAAVCVTYLRPRQLGHLLRCFELQDYADRELVILDDAGQYDGAECGAWRVTRGDRWTLYSTGKRFPTLGDKRNAAAALISDDAEAIAVWDDDDLYLPWALSASVAALRIAPWSLPSLVLHPWRIDGTQQHVLTTHAIRGPRSTDGHFFHGGWAYRRGAFAAAGGYPARDNGEDRQFAERLVAAEVGSCDPCALGFDPFYCYAWGRSLANETPHLSAMGRTGYGDLACDQVEPARLVAADPPWFDLRRPPVVRQVMPRMF